jgi:hypothetical protein
MPTKTIVYPASVDSYLRRVGAEPLNFRRAMVKIHKGAYYVERAMIKIGPEGVTCSVEELAPTKEEAALMAGDLALMNFPKSIKAKNSDGLKAALGAGRGALYEFRDRVDGGIIMVQQRLDSPKRYVPWVQLSDGDWACMEPDGKLPFWKPVGGVEAGCKIMIHEGAKAAAAADALARDDTSSHPWAKELAEYVHFGMIGGALAPHRSDWDEIRVEKPTEVVFLCDNDTPGISALQKVSQCWGGALKGILLGRAFDDSWDIADPMPKKFFVGKRYNGPTLKSMFQAATWATRLVPPADGKKGRPAAVLTDDFIEEWFHCLKPEVFLHRDWPNKLYSPQEFNSKVRPFSHVKETADLLKAHLQSKSAILKYEPGLDPGLYGGLNGGMFINTHQPTDVVAEEGDARPWTEFMEMLIEDDGDRHEAYRWMASLLKRPGRRPHYAMLLISTQQGVGKGTLGEKILKPLVGVENTSTPSEEMIVESAFDYWSPHKRLAIVHEIYAGHSSKAYNKMKSKITDDWIEVNQKFQSIYSIENHIMVFACSNSERALQIAADDRRWFLPKITDKKPGKEYWVQFNHWLTQEGGLGIISWWFDEWLKTNEAAEKGSNAPASAAKRAMVEDSYSPGMKAAQRAIELLRMSIEEGKFEGRGSPFILDSDLVRLVKETVWEGRQNEKLERPSTLREVAKMAGMFVGDVRVQIRSWGPEALGARILSFDEGVAATSPAELGGDKIPEMMRRRPFDIVGLGSGALQF